jgi:penicillin-binding protein 2
MLVCSLLAVMRSAWWQLSPSSKFFERADSNRSAIIRLVPPRGVLEDRFGVVLADNRPSWRLVVRGMPYVALSPAERAAWFEAVATRLEKPLPEIEKIFATYNPKGAAEIVVEENISYEEALGLLVKPLPPLEVELTTERQYPYTASQTLAHVLGYVGSMNAEEYESKYAALGYRGYDQVGKTGLEAAHEVDLRGTNGSERYEVDSFGRPLRLLSRTEPIPGQNLRLSLDIEFQQVVEESLARTLKQGPVERGAVVALEPQTGAILALVSYPGYEVNAFAGGIGEAEYAALRDNENAPLFARATAGEYPAGSTIKPIYVAAALTEGVIDESTTVSSTGGVWLGNRFFPDWRAGGHGLTDYQHAIADSVNTFFYILGGGNEVSKGMGLESLMGWAERFGFGLATGVDLPFEQTGFLPSKAWKEEVKGEPWYIGDTYNVSIGQGDFLVTPLQMAAATSVMAAEGVWRTPHLLLSEGAAVERPVISAEVAAKVAAAMRQTVTQGTATSLQAIPDAVAGKTGTAQWNANKAPHSWFTGFMPLDEPQIVIAVLAEEGGERGLAVTVAREILTWYSANRIIRGDQQ